MRTASAGGQPCSTSSISACRSNRAIRRDLDRERRLKPSLAQLRQPPLGHLVDVSA